MFKKIALLILLLLSSSCGRWFDGGKALDWTSLNLKPKTSKTTLYFNCKSYFVYLGADKCKYFNNNFLKYSFDIPYRETFSFDVTEDPRLADLIINIEQKTFSYDFIPLIGPYIGFFSLGIIPYVGEVNYEFAVSVFEKNNKVLEKKYSRTEGFSIGWIPLMFSEVKGEADAPAIRDYPDINKEVLYDLLASGLM